MSVEELEEGFVWLASKVYSDDDFNRRKRHFMDLSKARQFAHADALSGT